MPKSQSFIARLFFVVLLIVCGAPAVFAQAPPLERFEKTIRVLVASGRVVGVQAMVGNGDKVLLNFPAANHDPDVFERADEVVLDRERNRHIAFGVGIHRCAGSNLARMEMDVALRVWFERIPEFELTDPKAVRWAPGQVRGARCVPVRF